MGSEGLAGVGSTQAPHVGPLGGDKSKKLDKGPGPVAKVSRVANTIIDKMSIPFEVDRTLTDLQTSAVHFNTIPHTTLEGTVYSHSISNMSSFLREYGAISAASTGQGDPIATKAAGQLREMNRKMKRIEAIEVGAGKETLRSFSSEMMRDVRALGTGEKTLIPGGTLHHAMLYEVEKQSNGGYKLNVINTGDNIQNHHSKVIKGKRKYSPAYTITNIRGDKLDEQFFKTLIGYQVKKTDVSRIYDLVDGLGGRPMSAREYESHSGMFISPQKLGTCTHKALTAYLKMQYYQAPEAQDLSSEERIKPFKRMKMMSKISTLQNLAESMEVLKTRSVYGRDNSYQNHEKFVQLATHSFAEDFRDKKGKYGDFMSPSELEAISNVLANVEKSCSYKEKAIARNFRPSFGYGRDVVYNEAKVEYFPGNTSVVAIVDGSTGEIHSHEGHAVLYQVGLVFTMVLSNARKYSTVLKKAKKSFPKELKNTVEDAKPITKSKIGTGLVSSESESLLRSQEKADRKARKAKDHKKELQLDLARRIQERKKP